MEISLPYLSSETDRHGNPRLYVRRHGRRIRIIEKPGTPDFAKAYADALERLSALAASPVTPTPPRQPFPRGTLGWLGVQYFASEEFKALDAKSQSTRRKIFEACFDEPYRDDDPKPMGFCPLTSLTAHGVKRLRDLKKGLPGAANNRRKYLSSMFGWAVEESPPLMKTNPARDVRRIKYATEGFPTWTPDEVRQFQERHPIGTKARLALALLLFTGTRRGDVVTLGRQHVRDGWLRFIPGKTKRQRKVVSEKPLLPVLASIIAASPTGDLTFLVTDYGRPFTAAGFGAWFRKR